MRAADQHAPGKCFGWSHKQYLRGGREIVYLCDDCAMSLTDILIYNAYTGWRNENPKVVNILAGLQRHTAERKDRDG